MTTERSLLETQILDMYIRDIKLSEIAIELNCELESVLLCVASFQALEIDAKERRKECIERQNSFNFDYRELCKKHETCSTCDCKILNPTEKR